MTNIGSMYDDFVLQKRMKEVPVPTDDVDVMRYLRKLGEPICLFGEDPIDKKNRLRKLLVDGMAVNVDAQDNEPETIPKFEAGGQEIVDLKSFLIMYSAPRAKERKAAEQPITEERIAKTNQRGKVYSQYTSTASDHADKRSLSALCTRGDFFVVGSLSGAVSLWSISGMNRILDFSGHSDRITGATFVMDEIIATSSIDKTVRIWRNDGTSTSIVFPVPVSSIASHPSEKFIIAGLNDGNFSVIDIETEKPILQMKSNDGTVTSVAAHRDGGLIYSGGSDTVGRLWDLRSCKALKSMIGHSSRITCSTFDENYHCVTGACDNTCIVWDLRNLNRSKKIAAHTSAVSGVSLNGDLLLTSSLDSTVKIWSMLDFRTYASLKDTPSCIMKSCFAGNDGNTIITASKDGVWRFFTEPLF